MRFMENKLYFTTQPVVVLDDYHQFKVGFYELLLRDSTTNRFPGQAFFDAISEEDGNEEFLDFSEQQIRVVLQQHENSDISINLETIQLGYERTYRFLEDVKDIANHVILEITEREYSGQDHALIQFIRYAKRQGFRILLDDVDTHKHINSCVMSRLGIDGVKFSHQMVQQLPFQEVKQRLEQFQEEHQDDDVVMIVEGVNDQRQLEKLFDVGISYQQGFFFSPPKNLGR